MSKAADLAIKEVLEQHGEQWVEGTVWRVQGTAVISHKALERIAARTGIRFDVPTIIRAERDEAVMLVVGTKGDLKEWSVGECVINQNYRVSGKQAAYPWAMAEKRAKDRVILKLIALHGLVYSEEEADDFKGGRQSADAPADKAPISAPDDEHSEDAARERFIESCLATVRNTKTGPKLRDWWRSADLRDAVKDFALNEDEIARLKSAVTDRLQEIGRTTPDDPPRKANGHAHDAGARH